MFLTLEIYFFHLLKWLKTADCIPASCIYLICKAGYIDIIECAYLWLWQHEHNC